MPSAIPTKIWRLLPLRIEKVNLYANMEFQKPSPTCQKKSKKKKKTKNKVIASMLYYFKNVTCIQ